MKSNGMSNVTCARCTRHLRASNTNPDHLCGYCQAELGSHKGERSKRYKAWIAAGRPRLADSQLYAHVEEDTVEQAVEHGKLWDKRLLKIATLEFLLAAEAELTRRRKQVEKDAHSLGLRFRRSR